MGTRDDILEEALQCAPLQEKVEALVDAYSIQDVIQAIVETAYLKAEHLRTNWQNEGSAREWEAIAKELDRFLYTIID